MPKRPAALCYIDNWMKGFAVLTAYHAGSYYSGFEATLPDNTGKETGSLSEIILSNYNQVRAVKVPEDDEHRVPFWDTNLQLLWQRKDNPDVEFILIMCYSGYRISAYKNMEVNLEELYFNENDRKRMLGHVMKDITNKVYGHRTTEELRTEIEKIQIPSQIGSCD